MTLDQAKLEELRAQAFLARDHPATVVREVTDELAEGVLAVVEEVERGGKRAGSLLEVANELHELLSAHVEYRWPHTYADCGICRHPLQRLGAVIRAIAADVARAGVDG